MAAQCQLKAAAHAVAADGRDNRFFGGFHIMNGGGENRFLGNSWRAKLRDIRATGKRPVGSGDDNGFNSGVLLGLANAVNDTLAQPKAEAVNGGIVQADNGDVAV